MQYTRCLQRCQGYEARALLGIRSDTNVRTRPQYSEDRYYCPEPHTDQTEHRRYGFHECKDAQASVLASVLVSAQVLALVSETELVPALVPAKVQL